MIILEVMTSQSSVASSSKIPLRSGCASEDAREQSVSPSRSASSARSSSHSSSSSSRKGKEKAVETDDDGENVSHTSGSSRKSTRPQIDNGTIAAPGGSVHNSEDGSEESEDDGEEEEP